MKTFLRGIESLICGFAASGVVGVRKLHNYQAYAALGVEDLVLARPLSVWQFLGLALMVALLIFVVASVYVSIKKMTHPDFIEEKKPEKEKATDTEED